MKNILDAMIAMNFELRRNHPDVSKFLNPHQYAAEYKTIHLDVGRQTGKTHLMCTNARPTDLIIVHNQMTLDNLKHQYPMCKATFATVSMIDRIDYPFTGGYRSYPNYSEIFYDYIWIDEPELSRRMYNTVNIVNATIGSNLIIKLGK